MQSETSAAKTHTEQHTHAVARLYDKLFSFEVKKAVVAYPIHKKLTFPTSDSGSSVSGEPLSGNSVSDIYHWLAQQLPVADFVHILDAGCGVGFGCQTLTKYSSGHISGISLSADEVSQARRFADDAGVSRVSFEQRSFEELPVNRYDCVLMVESLKHCSDLEKAMASVSRALTQDGSIYVVEDVYQGEEVEFASKSVLQSLNQQLCDDWHLKKLWNFQDIESAASKADLSCTIKSDLTPLMHSQNTLLLKGKMALFSLLSKVSRSSVIPVYRGGFILDWLYAQNLMRYQVLELKKVMG